MLMRQRTLTSSRWFASWLDYIFPALLALGLIISPTPVWGLLFYINAPFYLFYRLYTGWRLPWRDPSVALALLLIIWSGSTLAWGYDPSGMQASKLLWLGCALSTLVFFCAWLMASDSAWLEPALLIGGALNALMAIISHFLWHADVPRMRGLGITLQPVLGAAIMGVLLVLALDRMLRLRRHYLLNGAAILVFTAFIGLTGSRGPLLATLFAIAYRLKDESRVVWISLSAAVSIVLIGGFILVPHMFRNILVDGFSRGDDYHTQLWGDALKMIWQHPWIGYGPTARLPIILRDLPYPFPHNLYLSLLFYSGAVGLGLFVALMTSLAMRAGDRFSGPVAICLIPLITGLTDLSQIIKGPAPIWYIFWVPVLLLTSALRRDEAAQRLNKPPNG